MPWAIYETKKECGEQFMKEKRMQQTISDALSVHVGKTILKQKIFFQQFIHYLPQQTTVLFCTHMSWWDFYFIFAFLWKANEFFIVSTLQYKGMFIKEWSKADTTKMVYHTFMKLGHSFRVFSLVLYAHLTSQWRLWATQALAVFLPLSSLQNRLCHLLMVASKGALDPMTHRFGMNFQRAAS